MKSIALSAVFFLPTLLIKLNLPFLLIVASLCFHHVVNY